jgi:hypothetical protein
MGEIVNFPAALKDDAEFVVALCRFAESIVTVKAGAIIPQ